MRRGNPSAKGGPGNAGQLKQHNGKSDEEYGTGQHKDLQHMFKQFQTIPKTMSNNFKHFPKQFQTISNNFQKKFKQFQTISKTSYV
jgi:hypothetical protein